MKIGSTSIQMQSTHAETSRHEVQEQEQLRAWVGPSRPDFEGMERGRRPALPAAIVEVSKAALASQAGEAQAIKDGS